MVGLKIGKTLSTPSPKDIFLTVNEELRPLFFFLIQTPSNAWIRSLVPSRTDSISWMELRYFLTFNKCLYLIFFKLLYNIHDCLAPSFNTLFLACLVFFVVFPYVWPHFLCYFLGHVQAPFTYILMIT